MSGPRPPSSTAAASATRGKSPPAGPCGCSPPQAGGGLQLRHSIGQILGCGLQPLELHDGEQWGALAWPRTAERRRQVLTLEQDRSGWGMFLPPLGRAPLEQLLGAIAAAGEPWSEPELSGVLPLDMDNASR